MYPLVKNHYRFEQLWDQFVSEYPMVSELPEGTKISNPHGLILFYFIDHYYPEYRAWFNEDYRRQFPQDPYSCISYFESIRSYLRPNELKYLLNSLEVRSVIDIDCKQGSMLLSCISKSINYTGFNSGNHESFTEMYQTLHPVIRSSVTLNEKPFDYYQVPVESDLVFWNIELDDQYHDLMIRSFLIAKRLSIRKYLVIQAPDNVLDPLFLFIESELKNRFIKSMKINGRTYLLFDNQKIDRPRIIHERYPDLWNLYLRSTPETTPESDYNRALIEASRMAYGRSMSDLINNSSFQRCIRQASGEPVKIREKMDYPENCSDLCKKMIRKFNKLNDNCLLDVTRITREGKGAKIVVMPKGNVVRRESKRVISNKLPIVTSSYEGYLTIISFFPDPNQFLDELLIVEKIYNN